MTIPWMSVNLLPPQPVRQRFSFSFHAIGLGILALSTISMSVLAWSAYQSNQNETTLLSDMTAQQSSQTEEVHTLQAKVSALESVKQAVQQSGQAVDVKQLLDRIISTGLNGISIQSLNYKQGAIDLVGSSANYANIALYEDELLRLPAVSSVWLSSVNNASNQYIFTINIALKEATSS